MTPQFLFKSFFLPGSLYCMGNVIIYSPFPVLFGVMLCGFIMLMAVQILRGQRRFDRDIPFYINAIALLTVTIMIALAMSDILYHPENSLTFAHFVVGLFFSISNFVLSTRFQNIVFQKRKDSHWLNLVFNPDIFSAIAYLGAAAMAMERPLLFTAAVIGFVIGMVFSSINAYVKDGHGTLGAPRLWFAAANLLALIAALLLHDYVLVFAQLFYMLGNIAVYNQSLENRRTNLITGLQHDLGRLLK